MFRWARPSRLFPAEQSHPDSLYPALAQDAVAQLEEHGPLAGQTVLDIGGGPGYLTAAVQARGGNCCLLEPDAAGLVRRRPPPPLRPTWPRAGPLSPTATACRCGTAARMSACPPTCWSTCATRAGWS